MAGKPTFAQVSQTMTLAGVLIGFGLVIWELRQSHDIARTDHITASFAMSAATYQAVLGEDLAASLEKACVAPEALTHGDIQVLKNYYSALLMQPYMLYLQSEGTVVEVGSWRSPTIPILAEVLSTPFGRFWWTDQQFWAVTIPGIGDLAERVMAATDQIGCDVMKTRYTAWLENGHS